MRMGNLLSARGHRTAMAAKNHSVGIDHVTVVPEPAAPEESDEDGSDADDEY